MASLYQRQLNYIFNRPVTEPAWYWSNDDSEEYVFDETPESAFIFIETLFSNPKNDLSPYSDEQIGLGLNYIFNGACSNLAIDFKAANLPFDRKIKAISALFNVFEAVLNPRCANILSANSQAKLSKIQFICYMFWDICCWSDWKGADETETKGYYEAIADVMRRCLVLSNLACVESGLHGLGHLTFSQNNIAVPIIDDFIKNEKKQHNALMEYAKMARTGRIQ